MELRQFVYFVTVVEEASFTKAAAKLHVAQPGVSAQIRLLEREFGEELLDRSGRAIRPTAVGLAVLPYARAALEAVSGARLVVEELAGLTRGRVAVGTVGPSSLVDLPGLLAGFHQNHPAVEITLSEANSDQLIDAVQHGELDVALIGLATMPPRGVATQIVADIPLVAAVSHADPLAARTTIALKALQARDLISLPRGSGLRTALDAACGEAGFQPSIPFEASDPGVLVRLASRGLGVAILSASIAADHREQLHALSIVRPRLRARIGLIWSTGGPVSPAARALVRYAREMLPDKDAEAPGRDDVRP
ncbi:MAG TPA: LysR family transcriptional regulator [Thermomicrobiales bacterium]|jgi:DNA-binding transcriptional LysR family regulator|nr:LysR family transcriptional regulator [Thermomicrobiales bacterium]